MSGNNIEFGARVMTLVDHLPMMTMTLVAPQLPTPAHLGHPFNIALGLQMADVTMIRRQEGSIVAVALNSTAGAVGAPSRTAVCLQASVCGLGRTSPMTTLAVEEQEKGLLHLPSTARDITVGAHGTTEGQGPNVSVPVHLLVVKNLRNVQIRWPKIALPA